MEKTKKTHWRKCDKSDYLGACDLCDLANPEIIATIEKVEIKNAKLRGGTELARVATFKEKNLKPMIINVQNSKVLLKFSGSKFVEDWANLTVSIFIEENVRMGADITEGLRFRKTKPVIKKRDILDENHPKWETAKENVQNGSIDLDGLRKHWDVSDGVFVKLQQ